MGRVRLFENWTFMRPFPEPFAGEVQRRGKKDTTDSRALSVHNHMTRGKRATLHAPTLRGLITLAEIADGERKGAAGYRMEQGKITCYCLETVKVVGASEEIRLLVYSPEHGTCKGMISQYGNLSDFPQFGERESSGKDILALMAYASTVRGSLYDEEFATGFRMFRQEWIRRSDIETLMNLGMLLCDNLYRRMENADALGQEGIPFEEGNLRTGNLPIIMRTKLEQGCYALTRTDYGVFQVLKEQERTSNRSTIRDIGTRYHRGFELNEKEKALVPCLPDTYEVSEEVTEILEAVCSTPMRVFMAAGDAGTGKSTNAKIAAQLLGFPYYFFTCGEGTDEVDLVSSMVPNLGKRETKEAVSVPTYRDFVMDPASALEMVSGTYEEGIAAEAAFEKILKRLYVEGCENGRQEKDFCLMESSIVTGCRRPSLIEIQEPSVISKPGTLVKLNGLLDDGASITLASGEVVKRNPDTVILLTTNMDYKGCRGFNESVLSRMRMLQFLEPLTAEAMVERVLKKVEFPNQALLRQMAETVCEIQKYCRTEMISGGVCGYREFEDWVWAYLVQKDVCRAARRTIVAKAAPEKEEREEIYKNQILTKFPEIRAA